MTESSDAARLPVSALLPDTVARIEPGATLLDVAGELAAADVGVLVVGDGGGVTAVVSERDVVRALAAHADPGSTTAIEVASTSLVWCDASAPVVEVANEMMDRYVRHVLVEEDGDLVGVVSARDLLGVYATADDDLDGGS